MFPSPIVVTVGGGNGFMSHVAADWFADNGMPLAESAARDVANGRLSINQIGMVMVGSRSRSW